MCVCGCEKYAYVYLVPEPLKVAKERPTYPTITSFPGRFVRESPPLHNWPGNEARAISVERQLILAPSIFGHGEVQHNTVL